MERLERHIEHPESCSGVCEPEMVTDTTGDVVHQMLTPPTAMERHPEYSTWWWIERHDELTRDGDQVPVETGFRLQTDHPHGVEWSLEEAEQRLEEMLAGVRAARQQP